MRSERERKFQNDDKQEAWRFLSADFDSYSEIINGMRSIKRVDAWQQVVELFNPAENKQMRFVKSKLHDRREQLVERRDNDFVNANELKAREFGGSQNVAAVTDGGAVAEESVETQYDGAADRRSQMLEEYKKAKMWTSVDEVEEKLQEEFARDERRPHVVDALEKRLKEVAES